MIVVVFLAVAAGFIVLGIIFLSGKGADLIAGYNTASPEEKADIDEKKAVESNGCIHVCSCRMLYHFGIERNSER